MMCEVPSPGVPTARVAAEVTFAPQAHLAAPRAVFYRSEGLRVGLVICGVIDWLQRSDSGGCAGPHQRAQEQGATIALSANLGDEGAAAVVGG